MQEVIVAVVVAMAVALLAAKGWQVLRRRCRNKDKTGCGQSCKCG